MPDIHHTLAIISEKLSIRNLALNGAGQAEIAFADGFSIYVTQIKPTIAEMSVRLEELDFANPPMMRAMLEANCLGVGTGSGRLGIDAVRGEVFYSERWDTSDLSTQGIHEKFSALMEYGVFWKTKGGDLLLAEAEKHQASGGSIEPMGGHDDDGFPVILRA